MISVIIPTYNRFEYLLNTIKSIKNQTYDNIEIIVVNDCSTDNKYYEYNWTENKVIILNLSENSKKTFGFACPGGYQRNFGITIAKGEYIAFCDDDDIWFPKKLELQIKAMRESGCDMSSTDGLIGNGMYDSNKKYQKFNAEYAYNYIKCVYRQKNSHFLDNGFPGIWNLDFLKINNCMICSSVIIKKDVIDKVGKFIIASTSEDYEYWLRALKYTNSVYVSYVCFYYDNNHGNGKQY